MTFRHDPVSPGMPGTVASLLDALRTGLANGRPELRATALQPLKSPGLRAAMLLNPRLSDRINARLASQKGWALPDALGPFAEAENVIHLLTKGPDACTFGIGLAWHGNTLSHLLMRGGAAVLQEVDPVHLRRALVVRDPDLLAEPSLPATETLERDGLLCLLAWAEALPGCIASTVMALLVPDPDVLARHPLGPLDGRLAAGVASRWLAADQGSGT